MKTAFTLAASAAVTLVAPIAAANLPLIETFPVDDANWRGVTESDVLTWVPTGGADGAGDGYVSNTFNFVDTPGDLPEIQDFQTMFRGQQNLGSSGGAFARSYVGLDTLSFSVRHDASEPLQFLLRLAGPANFPAVVYPAFTQFVQPGVWTEVTVPLDGAFPWIIAGSGSFDDIVSNIGNVQIAVNDLSSTGLPGLDQDITFDLDSVTLVPAPGAVGALGLAGLAAVRRRR